MEKKNLNWSYERDGLHQALTSAGTWNLKKVENNAEQLMQSN